MKGDERYIGVCGMCGSGGGPSVGRAGALAVLLSPDGAGVRAAPPIGEGAVSSCEGERGYEYVRAG